MTVSIKRAGTSVAPAIAIVLLLATPQVGAETTSSGIPVGQFWAGLVQPHHSSPITPLTAFSEPGLSQPRPPGRGVMPVLSFLPTLRQHRDSSPVPVLPLVRFDRSMEYMPYRNDHLRLPLGNLERIRGSSRMFKLSGGYAGPGNTLQGYGQATVRSSFGYVRAFASGHGTTESSFDDGKGNSVPYEYDLNSEQFVVGWTPSSNFEAFGVFLRNAINDDRTPSSGLDNIETDRLIGRTGFEWRNVDGVIDRVRGEFRIRDGERRNNNYSVRSFEPGPGQRRQEVKNERTFYDGRLFSDFKTGAFEHRIGFDGTYENRDGRRRSDSDPLSPSPQENILSARQFPNIDIVTVGPSWEGAYSFTEDDHVKLGASYRYVDADANAVDTIPDAPFDAIVPGLPASAKNLYRFYYGEDTNVNQVDHLYNGRLLYQHQVLDDRLTFYGELAHIQRAADSKERYWAVMAPPPAAANRQIGNPELDPEKHSIIGAGVTLDGEDWIGFGRARRQKQTILTGAWSLTAGVRYDRVNDFITRDRARGQNGVLADDGALVFRNVDADIFTAEAEAQWNITTNLASQANVIYTWAENTSDDRELYGIAPLEANFLLDYSDRLSSVGSWNVGSKLRLVADQNRVDDDPADGSGFDQGDTPAFTIWDFYAGVQAYDRIALRVGVENLLDASYEENVARDTVDFRQRRRIKAPGRNFFVRAIASF